LVEAGALQRSLFDQQNLVEIHTALYPDERLVACFNPLLAEERKRKREELLQLRKKSWRPSGSKWRGARRRSCARKRSRSRSAEW